MSGAVAAHAAYNGSGTQGLAVTNKVHDDDGDVMSVFWNKNDTTRQLLYGSSILEIPASGSGGSLKAGGNQIFTVNNDIDAVGDLYLQIATTGTADLTLKAFDLLRCIKRIEFMVGTQVWQTLDSEDIHALNMTEMSEDAFESFFLSMSGGFSVDGSRNDIGLSATPAVQTSTSTPNKNVAGVLRIPALSRSVGPKLAKFTDISENSYLLAGAPHQAVKIRVYMASTVPSGSGITDFTLKLYGQYIVMCNEEREQIKAMPSGIPKRLKMSQHVSQTFVHSGSFGSAATGDLGVYSAPAKLDLDHFSLFSSHIILAVTIPSTSTSIKNCSIQDVELKLNSSSFSGVLEGPLLTGPVSDALGLYSNGVYGGTANFADNYYVFPLASQAYGGSSVPLNRFDNIRMDINVVIAGTASTGFTSQSFTISATCVGETTALYKGGAASLAMY